MMARLSLLEFITIITIIIRTINHDSKNGISLTLHFRSIILSSALLFGSLPIHFSQNRRLHPRMATIRITLECR
jgi:hypothetical protein